MALTEEQRAKLNAKAAARSAAAPVQDVKREPVVVSTPQPVGQELNLKFSLSLLRFWLKGSIYVPSNLRTVQTKTRNTILGIIPAGKDEQSIPMSNISATMLKTKYRILPLLLGFIWAVLGIYSVPNSPALSAKIVSIVAMIIPGILICGSGIQTRLEIQRSGSSYEISVPFYEKAKMIEAKKFIDEAVNRTEERRDVEMSAQMIVDSMKR